MMITQLEKRIIKILENESYKNKLIEILKLYDIRDITDELLIDTIMMNPSCLFRDITKVKIDNTMLDFTNCIKKYDLSDNKIVILNSISRNGNNLKFASQKLKSNKDVVMKAVSTCGKALQYSNLKNNKDIVMKAILNDPESYYMASVELKNDLDIIKLFLVKSPDKLLEFDYLDNYTKVVKSVIKENGLALKYASKDLRTNKNVVVSACKNNIKALQYADISLLKNDSFIINLSKKLRNDQVIYYAHDSLLNSKDFVIKIINELSFNLYFINDKYKDDIEVVNASINKDIRNLSHASDRIKSNEQYVLELIKKHGPILIYAHKDLLTNECFMYKAIKEYNGSIKYLSGDLLNNKDFINKVKSINTWCYNYLKEV